jgi:hypothetical protein
VVVVVGRTPGVWLYCPPALGKRGVINMLYSGCHTTSLCFIAFINLERLQYFFVSL